MTRMSAPELPNHRAHITVCICTYKRGDFLSSSLESIERQVANGLFTFSVVISDNDKARSAEPVVSSFSRKLKTPLVYCCEPEQNIALARNCALKHARGTHLAFIDDDQFAEPDWLLTMFQALQTYKADGILGPVIPHFDHVPPKWFVRGNCFEDKFSRCNTGALLEWTQTRTGNVLIKREILGNYEPENMFDPAMGSGGEDKDFFKRMIARGRKFYWCDEAKTYETVPPERCRRSVLLRRALLRGQTSLGRSERKAKDILKSLVAFPTYTLALPFCACAGQHALVKYLIKNCDHAGRLLAAVGIHPIREKYILK